MAGAAMSMDLGQFARWAELAGQRLQGANLGPVPKRCRLVLVAASKQNFAGGHAPDGTPWAPLKRPRSRPRDRRVHGGTGQKPLRDTGIAMASLTAGGQGSVDRMTANELVYGTNLEYVAVHQYGHTFPARSRAKPWVFSGPDGKPVFTRRLGPITIPARPFLGWNDDMADNCANILADFYADMIGAA